jgi:hypothetical protein
LPVFLQSSGTVRQEICTISIAIPKKRIILHDALTEISHFSPMGMNIKSMQYHVRIRFLTHPELLFT